MWVPSKGQGLGGRQKAPLHPNTSSVAYRRSEVSLGRFTMVEGFSNF